MNEKTKIYIGGTFDCFHNGHVNLLARARELADFVVVAIHGDAFAEARRGAPIMRELERLEVVRSCRHVDLAFVVESHPSQRTYLELIRPNQILHGDAWTADSLIAQLGVTDDFLRAHGIELTCAPYTHGISTATIKQRIVEEHDEAVRCEQALTLIQ